MPATAATTAKEARILIVWIWNFKKSLELELVVVGGLELMIVLLVG
jgi:hypothetical protein